MQSDYDKYSYPGQSRDISLEKQSPIEILLNRLKDIPEET